jgi:hypothetical protein
VPLVNINDPQTSIGRALALLEDSIGFVYPAALGAVAQLGVADHLAAGPRSAAELAEATGADAVFLHRVLRLLVSRGILGEDNEDRFFLTPRGEPLRSDAPLSVHAAIVNNTAAMMWRPAGEMTTTLREGKPAFDSVFGEPLSAHLHQDPQAGAVFHEGMASISEVYDHAVAQRLDLPAKGKVVDVGGGLGGLLLTVLRRHDGWHGVLFDQEQTLAGHRLGGLGDGARWTAVPGDFFAEVPSGGDVYLLKGILHEWPDEQCVTILRNCRRAMAPGGRVLLVEAVIEPGHASSLGLALDVFMMGILPGTERTIAQHGALLTEAGLRLRRVIPTGTPASIIEAVAA